MFKKLLLVFSGKMSLNPAGYLAYLALERNPSGLQNVPMFRFTEANSHFGRANSALRRSLIFTHSRRFRKG